MPCTLCQNPQHRASHCPDLCDVLRDGFYTGGGGGGGGHDHDHEENITYKVDKFELCMGEPDLDLQKQEVKSHLFIQP
jgi:hypothetical protein